MLIEIDSSAFALDCACNWHNTRAYQHYCQEQGECPHSDFFVHWFPSVFFARRQAKHTFKYAGRVHPVASGHAGFFIQGVNRGWGDPVHLGIPIPVSTLESSTFLYIPFL